MSSFSIYFFLFNCFFFSFLSRSLFLSFSFSSFAFTFTFTFSFSFSSFLFLFLFLFLLLLLLLLFLLLLFLALSCLRACQLAGFPALLFAVSLSILRDRLFVFPRYCWCSSLCLSFLFAPFLHDSCACLLSCVRSFLLSSLHTSPASKPPSRNSSGLADQEVGATASTPLGAWRILASVGMSPRARVRGASFTSLKKKKKKNVQRICSGLANHAFGAGALTPLRQG